ncbi:MAG: tetratricopeptide repeat protein [Candidatus Microthrix parvicella]
MSSADGVEEAWRQLHTHLDRARSFWLGFIFVSDPADARLLAERASWNRRFRAEPFLELQPSSPEGLAASVSKIEADGYPPRGCTWVEAVHTGDGPGQSLGWDAAWIDLLQSLNHRRDTLRSSLGGLIIVAPPSIKVHAMRVSTDLWSVRDFLVEVAPTVGFTANVASSEPTAGPTTLSSVPLTLPPTTTPDHDEIQTVLAMSDSALGGRASEQLNHLIEQAKQAGEGELLTALYERRGRVRLGNDPAGARHDLRKVAGSMPDQRGRLIVLEGLRALAASAGDADDALALSTEAEDLAERLAEQLGTPEALRDHSVSLDNLGDVYRAQGDWTQAEAAYQSSLNIAERLAEQLGTPEALRDHSISLNNLGDVYRAQGDWTQAEAAYQSSLNIRERLAEQLGTPEALRDHSISLNKLSELQDLVGPGS